MIKTFRHATFACAYVKRYKLILWIPFACTGDVDAMQRRRERKGRKRQKAEGKWEGGDLFFYLVFFFIFPLTISSVRLVQKNRRRMRRGGWRQGYGEKQSKKNVNTVAKMQTKDKQHSTFLSLTLHHLSLCRRFSGILGLLFVTKQPESCRNCVRETGKRVPCRIKVAPVISLISQGVYVWHLSTACTFWPWRYAHLIYAAHWNPFIHHVNITDVIVKL